MISYLPIAIASIILYAITLGIYRIYFSPLSHIPGSKLAAATRWYEFYHDGVKCGQYYKEIERMHEKYGKTLSTTFVLD